MSYRIAAPDEYLAITGLHVKNVRITKAAWVWPLQRCYRFSVQPHDYAMNLQGRWCSSTWIYEDYGH